MTNDRAAVHSREREPQPPQARGLDRRAFLRWAGAACAGAVGSSALAACGGSSAASGATASANRVVLASVPSYANAYFTMWRQGGQEAAQALGLQYVMQSYEGSATEQLAQLQAAKAAGAAQVTAFPIDNGDTAQMAKTLASQGIYLATAFDAQPWEVPSDPAYKGYYSVNFLMSEVEGMRKLSLAVFRQIGNSGKVIYIQGAPTDLTSVLRERGFDEAVQMTPGIQVVAKQYGYEAEATTAPVIGALLSQHPDVAAVVCHNSSEALAVDAALAQRGMSHVKVGSSDEEVDILDQMINGPNQVVVRAIFGVWTGGYMVVRNFDAANGVPITPVERLLNGDSLVLDTKESAQLFKQIIFERSTSGYDWRKMSRHLHPNDWDAQTGMAPLDPNVLFTQYLGKPRPAGYQYPPELEKQLQEGAIAHYTSLYAQHVRSSPVAPAIRATTSGETVLGFKV
ncbi:MAG TPA: sugar ABC transporter substrate-binding protein [Solirubrobacteraceae bacterium]|nr:sugar ABC transporter substrate-binding protein [Solirubrobacteraceae bacterium]